MKESKIISISAREGNPYNWNPQKLESILDDKFTHLVDSIRLQQVWRKPI